MIQNVHPYTVVKTVEGATQTIAQGPVASQEAIKQIGTNGGGFFNANSAHPFENPSPLTNFLSEIFMFAICAGLTYTFGHMVKDTRQGWALFWAMSIMFLMGVFVAYPAEQAGNPVAAKLGVETAPTLDQSGGNMEGKETRFGIATSALFATATTDATCGAINSQHDSFTPLGGLVPLFNIQTDEVIFGGVGSGLFAMLLYAIVGIFITGLMVGRTPEYLGKKIQRREVTDGAPRHSRHIVSDPRRRRHQRRRAVCEGRLLESAGPRRWRTSTTPGPHGLSEVLYAYSSAAENNGSAFAGITAGTPWYDLTLGLCDPLRPLPVHDSLVGDCREPRAQEEDAGVGRHAGHSRAAVRRRAGDGGHRDRRPDVLSRALAGPHRGALPGTRRQVVRAAVLRTVRS